MIYISLSHKFILSNILKIPLYDNPNFKKLDTIYTSELDDIGNLTCTKDNIYFVKTVDYNQKIKILENDNNLLDMEVLNIKHKDFNLEELKNENQIFRQTYSRMQKTNDLSRNFKKSEISWP